MFPRVDDGTTITVRDVRSPLLDMTAVPHLVLPSFLTLRGTKFLISFQLLNVFNKQNVLSDLHVSFTSFNPYLQKWSAVTRIVSPTTADAGQLSCNSVSVLRFSPSLVTWPAEDHKGCLVFLSKSVWRKYTRSSWKVTFHTTGQGGSYFSLFQIPYYQWVSATVAGRREGSRNSQRKRKLLFLFSQTVQKSKVASILFQHAEEIFPHYLLYLCHCWTQCQSLLWNQFTFSSQSTEFFLSDFDVLWCHCDVSRRFFLSSSLIFSAIIFPNSVSVPTFLTYRQIQ